jgi:hypothetical protein
VLNRTPQSFLQIFKELVAAAIGLILVIATVDMAFRTFALSGAADKINDAKNVLIMMMGLAGVVIGYYFGRVPADARASQSESRANAAIAHATHVTAVSNELLGEAERIATVSTTRGGDGNIQQSIHDLRSRMMQLAATPLVF